MLPSAQKPPSTASVTPGAQPPVPTMTNASLIPPEPPPINLPPEYPAELAEDIVARPLALPDFVNVPQKDLLRNPNLVARWIFTDRRRFAQAKSQGWRVANKNDIKLNALEPYEEEGGTKFINGDLVLMVIDRKIYLGALRYKHQVAANFADAAAQKNISAQKAIASMPVISAINQRRAAAGADPVMTVFTPGAADLHGVMTDPNVAAKEIGRVGEGVRDIGTLADLAKQVDKT